MEENARWRIFAEATSAFDAQTLDPNRARDPRDPPSPTLELVACGTLVLDGPIAVWAPDMPAERVELRASGTYELVAFAAHGWLQAVVLRMPAALAATWERVELDVDEHLVVTPADAPTDVEYPGVGSARDRAYLGTLSDGRTFVWIADPSGSGTVTVAVGLDADGQLAALVVEV